jgi:hypothetical protein
MINPGTALPFCTIPEQPKNVKTLHCTAAWTSDNILEISPNSMAIHSQLLISQAAQTQIK